jgi:hypothetical protein
MVLNFQFPVLELVPQVLNFQFPVLELVPQALVVLVLLELVQMLEL